ncbi:SDR family NAD(P)-dependent oxidoreductase, partial [Streptomyces lasiicapitis]|uniref:SDR family NAD(P)-dependent oxidoreductase n=1 Tax=Streptomyces lasiicapitis TaxID=1923961 RepID=UPI00365A87CA
MSSLNGKNALVTGGSRGIGAATALRLAQEGADVAFTYVQGEDTAREIVAKIESMGRRGFAIRADAGDPGDAAGAVERGGPPPRGRGGAPPSPPPSTPSPNTGSSWPCCSSGRSASRGGSRRP